MERVNYRPDIEGLRALAILMVVGAHAHVPGLQGGFVGVDIFFVISGYLISGLLVSERVRTDRIDIAAFYARRFRRLLPALMLMLAATALATCLLLPPQGQSYQASAGAAASVWASNLYFAFEDVDYFDAASEYNTYLHTWSLGIEEQFYLVWPLLILLLRPRGKSGNEARLSWGMTAILLASLLACFWMTLSSVRHAFYLMPLRAWEFAAGAVACLFSPTLSRWATDWQRDWVGEALGVGGIVLLLSALALVGRGTAYPGTWAILPVSGAACLLLAASAGRSIVTRALSLAPMQAIGKVSYGWYLWHWPALVLGALLIPAPGLVQRLWLLFAALALAFASYRLVEQPVRRNAELIREPRRFILASLLLMLGAVSLFVRWGELAQASSQTPAAGVESSALAMAGAVPAIYTMGCDDWYRSDRLVPCVFGPPSAPGTVVAIGDSIGLQWFPAYAKIFHGPQWRLVVLTKSSCPMVDSPIFNPRIGREFTECASWRDKALEYIVKAQPEIVIMGTTHTAGFSRETWVSGTDRVLSRIAAHSGRIIIMRSTPLLPFNGPECAWTHAGKSSGSDQYKACSAPAADPLNDEVAAWLGEAARKWKNVDVINMNDEVCPDGTCRAVIEGVLTYRDTQHLTAQYVESLADQLRVELGDVLKQDSNVDAPQ